MNLTCGKRQHHGGRLSLRTFQRITIQRQKQTRGKKRCALVAIDEGMILGQTKRIGRCQVSRIGCAICRQIRRTCECRMQQSFIAYSSGTAVLCQTFSMQQQQSVRVYPAPIHLARSTRDQIADLLRKLVKSIAILTHKLTSRLQLLGKRRIVWRDDITLWRLRKKKRIALFQLEPRNDFFGQDDTNGITDLSELECLHLGKRAKKCYNERYNIDHIKNAQECAVKIRLVLYIYKTIS